MHWHIMGILPKVSVLVTSQFLGFVYEMYAFNLPSWQNSVDASRLLIFSITLQTGWRKKAHAGKDSMIRNIA